jgi:uncharacterized protein involved in exopolysaccharide biosynthesis
MNEQLQETDEISLKELIQKAGSILGYLKTQWWKLLLISLLGGIGGYVYAKFQKPKYTAKLTFALAEGGDKMGGISSIASQWRQPVGIDEESVTHRKNLVDFSRFIWQAQIVGKPIYRF